MNNEKRDLSDVLFWSGYGFDRGTCNDLARQIYEQGYRKQSDTARDIFAEIDKLLCSLDKRHMMCGNPKQSWGVRSAMAEIAKLKKKYGVTEE